MMSLTLPTSAGCPLALPRPQDVSNVDRLGQVSRNLPQLQQPPLDIELSVPAAMETVATLPSESFVALLLMQLPQMRGLALKLTRNHAAAEDLLQDTGYRALRAHQQFEIGTNVRAWLFRVLRTTFINSVRGARRPTVPFHEVSEEQLGAAANQETIVLNQEIRHAMKGLKAEYRQVLELVCAEEYTYREAADVLQCTVATVKSRVWRARRQLDAIIREGDFAR